MRKVIVIVLFILPFFISGCGRTEFNSNTYIHEGKMYIKGEVKPYTGIIKSDKDHAVRYEKEYRDGIMTLRTVYYQNGNKRFVQKGDGGATTFFSPEGEAISKHEYDENGYIGVL